MKEKNVATEKHEIEFQAEEEVRALFGKSGLSGIRWKEKTKKTQ